MNVGELIWLLRPKNPYFSQVSNVALRDSRLSLKAKGLYSLIESYITMENYVLYKTIYITTVQKKIRLLIVRGMN